MWKPCFLRPFNNWEVDLVGRFIGTIQGKKAIPKAEDMVTWKENKNGNFIAKSLFVILEPRVATLFPHKNYLELLGASKSGFLCM